MIFNNKIIFLLFFIYSGSFSFSKGIPLLGEQPTILCWRDNKTKYYVNNSMICNPWEKGIT